jgi:hypothetical protein
MIRQLADIGIISFARGSRAFAPSSVPPLQRPLAVLVASTLHLRHRAGGV